MFRLALLVALASVVPASAQTADAIREITELLDKLSGQVPTTVTYDLTKLVKSHPKMNTVEKVLAELEAEGALAKSAPTRDPADQVRIAPGNKLVVRALPRIHTDIASLLTRMKDPAYEDRTARGLFAVPAIAIPPGGLQRVQVVWTAAEPPKKKK